MENNKFCINCRHCYPGFDPICNRPVSTSLVTGNVEVKGTICSYERYSGKVGTWIFDTCGAGGRYFNEIVK